MKEVTELSLTRYSPHFETKIQFFLRVCYVLQCS
ncbi:hypothetical protein T03_11822 [Trichinella britovi]|uniref:Uncharacterized protein n=1 Tax=Trichinella britovi TaxID=45882 RepID=A0A0V0ZQ77_TRIBR|nr:hypothetical protein T03_14258 [Trichinella britovi]KRY25136.1 hypothetical protein T03_11822 [Trichinella britovi]